jgi:hypothetical protein
VRNYRFKVPLRASAPPREKAFRRGLTLAAAVLAFLVLLGCNRGPAVGTVKGTVTLDGQPVDGGLIRLVPSDGNSQPADCQIAAGAYSITMPVGEKKVEIYWTKTNTSGPVDTASQGSEKVVALVPSKYNVESTLTVMVEKGEAVKNFELTSR